MFYGVPHSSKEYRDQYGLNTLDLRDHKKEWIKAAIDFIGLDNSLPNAPTNFMEQPQTKAFALYSRKILRI